MLQAIRRHPILFVMPLVALTLVGAAVGYLRAPTYKATSQLVVGQLNVADPAAVGSVIQASQTTAAVYSRMINSAGVRKGIADKVHGKATGTDISATPIPGSPLIRVTAAASSEGTAVTVANAAADALKKYASQYGTTSSDPSAIYSDYKAAALKVSRSQAKVGAIAAAFARDRSAANRRRLDVAQSNLQAAQLKRDTLKFDYSTSQQSVRFTPGIHTFTAAAAASSDRRSWMEILGLIGLVAGIALGAALATAALKRRMARLVAV